MSKQIDSNSVRRDHSLGPGPNIHFTHLSPCTAVMHTLPWAYYVPPCKAPPSGCMPLTGGLLGLCCFTTAPSDVSPFSAHLQNHLLSHNTGPRHLGVRYVQGEKAGEVTLLYTESFYMIWKPVRVSVMSFHLLGYPSRWHQQFLRHVNERGSSSEWAIELW